MPQDYPNQPFLSMKEIALEHLKLNQPERYAQMKKSNQLEAWVKPRVEPAKAEYGRLVESGEQAVRAKELAMRNHLLVGYEPEELDQSKKCLLDSEQDDSYQTDNGETENETVADLNARRCTMELVLLDHMKLNHSERLDELTESGELDDFIVDHVKRAEEGYARLVLDEEQMLNAFERALTDYILIDFQDEREEPHFPPEQDEDSQTDEGDDNDDPASTERTGKPEGPGEEHFPVEGFMLQWDGDPES